MTVTNTGLGCVASVLPVVSVVRTAKIETDHVEGPKQKTRSLKARFAGTARETEVDVTPWHQRRKRL